jgi:hypothetical protein
MIGGWILDGGVPAGSDLLILAGTSPNSSATNLCSIWPTCCRNDSTSPATASNDSSQALVDLIHDRDCLSHPVRRRALIEWNRRELWIGFGQDRLSADVVDRSWDTALAFDVDGHYSLLRRFLVVRVDQDEIPVRASARRIPGRIAAGRLQLGSLLDRPGAADDRPPSAWRRLRFPSALGTVSGRGVQGLGPYRAREGRRGDVIGLLCS